MKLRIAGKLLHNNEAAIPRAKSYHGIQPHNEFFADCVIQYKNDVAAIIPLPVSQYVSMTLPNPIPYRGVSIGVVPGGTPAPVSVGGSGESWAISSPNSGTSHQTGSLVNVYHAADPPNYPTEFLWYQVYSNWLALGGVYNGIGGNNYNSSPANSVTITPVSQHPAYVAAAVIEQAIAAQNPAYTYVVASNGEVLAREVFTPSPPNPPLGIVYDADISPQTWNGDGYLDFFTNALIVDYGCQFKKRVTFAVPDDCIYPVTPTPPLYPGQQFGNTNSDSPLVSQWNADWAEAQTALKLRRKLWFKKNHDTVISQLRSGTFSLPVGWRYQFQRKPPTSTHTYRTPALDAVFPDPDEVVSDTSDDLSKAGTKVTKRVTTLSYSITVGGEVQDKREIIEGRLTQVVTKSENTSSGGEQLCIESTYEDWYVSGNTALTWTDASKNSRQILIDKTTATGFGLFWNGVFSGVYKADSTFGTPDDPLDYAGFSPQVPSFVDTTAGTATQFVLDYRAAVPIKYDKTGSLSSTAWNDSALMDGESVRIILYGPVNDGDSLGIFGELPADATNVKTEVFGAATYTYKYADGSFTFTGWQDADSANETSKIIDLTPDSNNTIAQYIGLQWPDVITAAKVANKALQPPVPPAEDTRTDAQKLQYEIAHAFS